MNQNGPIVAGVDAGSECIKALILDSDQKLLGRSIVPAQGYFQTCVQEALAAALEEAQVSEDHLASLYATGFAASAAPESATIAREIACHVRTAYRHFPEAMTVIDIGGRNPKVIAVDESGTCIEGRMIRRCSVGIGSFLIYAARHLDVHPTRLQELAAAADRPANISSYCSVFGSTELLEQLRDGATREQLALGAMYSVAERIVEVGDLLSPLVVTGGVAEFFPGVLKALEELSGLSVKAVPDPIAAGALGAALKALEAVGALGASEALGSAEGT